jgi:hypothetical protein
VQLLPSQRLILLITSTYHFPLCLTYGKFFRRLREFGTHHSSAFRAHRNRGFWNYLLSLAFLTPILLKLLTRRKLSIVPTVQPVSEPSPTLFTTQTVYCHAWLRVFDLFLPLTLSACVACVTSWGFHFSLFTICAVRTQRINS